ncbi:MAG: dTDP-4-dehydrorhamnose 3,5-epimerase family protein [Elusimicrobia bacterium]|nr:dTDP-4-dehydrorhamnose 3,5-epimerase family protein [Elusimicrobiota bacterium]
MKFTELELKGAYLIELEEFKDDRGTFSRQFCKNEFAKYGVNFDVCQCNISKNYKKNTIRGMHYQKSPFLEPKIVSCLGGSFYDVIVDLRKDSPTYLQWGGIELTSSNNKMLYIPPMFAHGFQTLEDDTTVYYQLGEFFKPECYAGLRYDDPKLGVKWKDFGFDPIMNDRDKNYELL